MKKQLQSSVILITGGTGSFGSNMVSHLLQEGVAEIRVFSRDESKQDLMRNHFKDERLKFIIGDVRECASLEPAIEGSDYVFHAAALKQVPSCEFFPMQAVSTNVLGSSNVLSGSIKYGVKGVVCLSTDKAVYPINAMGISKAMMEKVAQSYARNNPESKTKISITRYGNVLMSRGSILPLIISQIQKKEPITITNPKMTRFLMSLDDSVSLVKYAFTNATTGDIFVKKSPSCSVATLVSAISKIMNVENEIKVKYIGTRHGEKLYETLLSVEEIPRTIDMGDYYKVKLDSRSLDYQIYFTKGQKQLTSLAPYTSNNTLELSVDDVIKVLLALPELSSYKENFENEKN